MSQSNQLVIGLVILLHNSLHNIPPYNILPGAPASGIPQEGPDPLLLGEPAGAPEQCGGECWVWSTSSGVSCSYKYSHGFSAPHRVML